MGIWTWIWTRPPKGTDQLVECKVTGWPPKEPRGHREACRHSRDLGV